jgi:hypothetical protein
MLDDEIPTGTAPRNDCAAGWSNRNHSSRQAISEPGATLPTMGALSDWTVAQRYLRTEVS